MRSVAIEANVHVEDLLVTIKRHGTTVFFAELRASREVARDVRREHVYRYSGIGKLSIKIFVIAGHNREQVLNETHRDAKKKRREGEL